MAQKTTMQKLIELLEYRYKVVNDSCVRSTLELTIEDATLLLAMEKEQIINAHSQGLFGEESNPPTSGYSEQYYNETYNK